MDNLNRQDIFDYVKKEYGTEPEYLWIKTPENAVLRNERNRKWYGVILSVSRDKLGLSGNEVIDILDLKCDPLMIDMLRQEKGFLPAYHMNKKSWLAVLLDGTVEAKRIFNLIDFSYELTDNIKKK